MTVPRPSNVLLPLVGLACALLGWFGASAIVPDLPSPL